MVGSVTLRDFPAAVLSFPQLFFFECFCVLSEYFLLHIVLSDEKLQGTLNA
jgi:hypothetical protein